MLGRIRTNYKCIFVCDVLPTAIFQSKPSSVIVMAGDCTLCIFHVKKIL